MIHGCNEFKWKYIFGNSTFNSYKSLAECIQCCYSEDFIYFDFILYVAYKMIRLLLIQVILKKTRRRIWNLSHVLLISAHFKATSLPNNRMMYPHAYRRYYVLQANKFVGKWKYSIRKKEFAKFIEEANIQHLQTNYVI